LWLAFYTTAKSSKKLRTKTAKGSSQDFTIWFKLRIEGVY
jgi:hypothetical protein